MIDPDELCRMKQKKRWKWIGKSLESILWHFETKKHSRFRGIVARIVYAIQRATRTTLSDLRAACNYTRGIMCYRQHPTSSERSQRLSWSDKEKGNLFETAFRNELRKIPEVIMINSAARPNVEVVNVFEGSTLHRYIIFMNPISSQMHPFMNNNCGSNFCVYRRLFKKGQIKDPDSVTVEDALQPGRQIMFAGYMVWGVTVTFILSPGKMQGSYEFVLDEEGVFRFKRKLKLWGIPEKNIYSFDAGRIWDAKDAVVAKYIARKKKKARYKNMKCRCFYTGCLENDLHITLVRGGIYLSPPWKSNPNGNVKIQFGGNPMAWVFNEAGGWVSMKKGPVMEVEPQLLHETSPIFAAPNSEMITFIEFTKSTFYTLMDLIRIALEDMRPYTEEEVMRDRYHRMD